MSPELIFPGETRNQFFDEKSTFEMLATKILFKKIPGWGIYEPLRRVIPKIVLNSFTVTAMKVKMYQQTHM